ncbi:MAG: putative transport system permease protein [Micromonosporaceae bacterium]
MIGLVFAALRSRPAQALTVALLAAFVTASAVGVPVFLAAADRAVIGNEWAAASMAERTVRASSTVDLSGERDRSFESTVPARLSGGGFTRVFAAEADVNITGNGAVANPRFVFREDVCAHLALLSGRCPAGSGEVLVGQGFARLLGLGVGQAVRIQHAIPLPPPPPPAPPQAEGLGPNPAQPPMTVSVVGVFRVPDPGAAYWAMQSYFDANSLRNAAEPVFTTRGTLEALGHSRERQYVDALLDRSALRADRLAALRATIATRQGEQDGGAQTTSGIPALLDRIDRDRTTMRQVVPLAAVPLFGLGWFLLYFAVTYSAGERRGEIGVVKLRGTGRIRRWGLALGDSALAVLAGSGLGALAGAVAGGGQIWRYALPALAGGLVAVVLAGRRTFAGPVVDLLRQVPARSARWQAATVEGVLVALAVAAVLTLRSSTGTLTGLTLFAPGLVVLAVALLVARLVVPAAAASGNRALRRGRLARGLGALQLARRPGTARLLTVLVVALAELIFATGAADVAAQARTERVSVTLGAPRVLSVAPVPAAGLLGAVRRVDPQGRYAMAVSTVPPASDGDPPLLAVDASRLPQVASWWPEFGPLSAARVAARLRPPPSPAPVLIHGQEIVLDLTVERLDPAAGLHLFADVITVDDSFSQLADFGALRAGRHRYEAVMTRCLYVCRLTGFQLASASGVAAGLSLLLHGLTEGVRSTPLDAGFTRPGRWRTPQVRGDDPAARLGAGPDGLAVRLSGPATVANSRIVPVDTPYPLPVVSTAPLPRGTLGGAGLPVVRAGSAAVLPSLGRSGAMVDLEYADRMASSTEDASSAAVWLSASAPADIERRLAAAGLTVTGSRTIAADVRYLRGQGPGAGLRYHLLAGLLGMLLAVGGLALVAAVDRRRGPELWTLRAQGLPARTIARANRFAYATLVVAAVLLAPVAAAAAWWATGAQVPIFADGRTVVPPPAWPGLLPVLWPWLLAGALLLVAASVITSGRISPRRRRS